MCLLAGVEALVGWLLDHADMQATGLSDADTGSEECSDEEVVEDVDDAAYAMVSVTCVAAPCSCLPVPVMGSSVMHWGILNTVRFGQCFISVVLSGT